MNASARLGSWLASGRNILVGVLLTAVSLGIVAWMNRASRPRRETAKRVPKELPIYDPPKPPPRPVSALQRFRAVKSTQALAPAAKLHAPSMLPPLATAHALEGARFGLPALSLGIPGALPLSTKHAHAPKRTTPARPLRRPAPAYPRSARLQGIEGSVVVRLCVDARGNRVARRGGQGEPAGHLRRRRATNGAALPLSASTTRWSCGCDHARTTYRLPAAAMTRPMSRHAKLRTFCRNGGELGGLRGVGTRLRKAVPGLGRQLTALLIAIAVAVVPLPRNALGRDALPKDAAAMQRARRAFARIEQLARTAPDLAARQLHAAKLPRLWALRLQGLIALSRGDGVAALTFFERALRGPPNQRDPRLQLYVAHASILARRFRRALGALSHAHSLRATSVAYALLSARALRGVGRDSEAYRGLVSALARFGDRLDITTELVALCAERRLYAEARRFARQALRHLGVSPSRASQPRAAALMLIHALHGDRKASTVLEAVAAHYPTDATVQAHLAHAYAGWQRHYAAARLFDRATTILGGDFAFEAADQYRLAGVLTRGLALNAQVGDERRRLEQRLSLLFSARRMALVVAVAPMLKAAKLWTPRIRYQVGYAHYALGEHVAASSMMRSLENTAYHGSAKALLGAMGRATRANKADHAPRPR